MIIHRDLIPLIDHAKNRTQLSSTTLDAFGSHIQDLWEPSADFLIFSSWLGPLIRGLANPNFVGSFEENVMLAVSYIEKLNTQY